MRPHRLTDAHPRIAQGGWVYLAGHLPFKEDMKTLHVGRVGDEFTQEEAEELAKVTGLELISSLKTAVGDLDKVPLPPRPSPRLALTLRFTRR